MSIIAQKLIQLVQLGFGRAVDEYDELAIQYEVEEYGLEHVEDGIIIEFLDILLSGEEHTTPVDLPDERLFFDFLGVLSELSILFDLQLHNYGEWTLWHLPQLGYSLYIQFEASPSYFVTDKRMLGVSYEEAIQRYYGSLKPPAQRST